MSEFDLAIPTILRHEGGLSEHPADPGGLTNYGIILPVLKEMGEWADRDGDGDADPDDIRALTQEDAKQVYRARWWDRFGYSEIEDQAVATKIFDLAVNFGWYQGHKIAQRAVRAASGGKVVLVEDGILGPISKREINADWRVEYLPAIRAEAAGVYRMIASGKPELEVFLKGWLNRAYE